MQGFWAILPSFLAPEYTSRVFLSTDCHLFFLFQQALIRQRIYGLVMGYENLNDHEELRHDPMFALALGKRIGVQDEPAILAGNTKLI
jgi:hypothetical protein